MAKKTATPKPKRTPRAADLPGMEDRGIKELDDAGAEYADIRDQRIQLNATEANLKAAVLKLMKQHKKVVYQHGDITITLVAEEETVKVRVKKPAADDDDEDGDGAQD